MSHMNTSFYLIVHEKNISFIIYFPLLLDYNFCSVQNQQIKLLKIIENILKNGHNAQERYLFNKAERK